MRNPFQAFPARPPARILLYGDPGTEKTRRALMQMPGPVALMDLEAGATYYSDIAPPGSMYLPTRSVTDVTDAVGWLESAAGKAVGTVVVDPVTVIWEQLQEGFRHRTVERSKRGKYPKDAEDVIIDAGGWGRLNSLHASLMTRLLNLPQHVVWIGRGKETTDDDGKVTGYVFLGQKAVPFLVSTVIQTRAGGDIVEKDRSGALKAGKQPRVNLGAIVRGSGSTVVRVKPEDEAVAQDTGPDNGEPDGAPTEHHASWTDTERNAIAAILGEAGGFSILQASAALQALNKPRLTAMDAPTRAKAVAWLTEGAGRPHLDGWLTTPIGRAVTLEERVGETRANKARAAAGLAPKARLATLGEAKLTALLVELEKHADELEAKALARFVKDLEAAGLALANVSAWALGQGLADPVTMSSASRKLLLADLTGEGRQAFNDWLDGHLADGAA